MMKNTNNRGAALMIALLAAVVVMMAATLLISVTKKMVDAHVDRLNSAQVSLSEASAADGLAFLLTQNGPWAVAEGPLHFDLAGVSTEFSLLETGTAGIRTGFYPVDNAQRAIYIPAGNRLVSVQKVDESSVLITYFSGETFNPTTQFSLETDLSPVSGTPFIYQGEEAVAIVFEGGNKALIAVVTSDGIQVQTSVNSSILSPDSRISAAESSDGSPMLIATGGANIGALYNCESGQAWHIGSPSGTCPAFFPDGTMFGSVSDFYGSFGAAHIVDNFIGDFNNDGRTDMAFATRFSLSVYSGSTGEILRSSPGGSLTSWGSVGGRTGLCGMWKMPSGENKWFRLGYDGFNEFNPEMVYNLGWEGRFQGLGNTLTGFIDGSAVIASSAGYIQELLSGDGNIFIGDADGGETDFFSVSGDGVDACFNPVNGDGIQMAFSSVNRYRGKSTPGETYIFSVYESDGRVRVFHALEGLDE